MTISSTSTERGWMPTGLTAQSRTFLFVIGLVLFVSCTVAPQFELGWHDRQRAAQIGLFAFLGLMLLSASFRLAFMMSVRECSKAVRIGLVCAAALGTCSACFAIQPRWALAEVSLSILTIALAIGVATGVRALDRDRERWLIAGAATLAIAYGVVVLARIAPSAIAGEPLYISHLFEGFSNPRFFGQVQSMLVPVLAAGVLVTSRPAYRRCLIGVLVCWWFFVLLASTRGTWIGLIAGGLFALLAIPKSARGILILNAASAIVGAILYATFVFAMQAIGNAAEPILRSSGSLSSTHDRLHLWGMALDLVKEHPWLGVGPMHFAYERNPFGAHPHNFFFQWLAEWGVPATACLIGVIFLALRGWGRFARAKGDYSKERGYLIAALTASVGAALTQALVDGVLAMPYSQVLFATLCGWMLGIYQGERFPLASGGSLSIRASTAVIASVTGALGLLVYSIYPEAADLIVWEESSAAMRTPEGFLYYFPRLWIQGWIGPVPAPSH